MKWRRLFTRLQPSVLFSIAGAAAICLLSASCSLESGHLAGADFGAVITSRDPAYLVSLLTSTATPVATRIAAEGILRSVPESDAARVAALEQIARASREVAEMRVFSLRRLTQDAPSRATALLATVLPSLEGELLAEACLCSVTLNDARLLDPLIVSLDRAEGSAETVRTRPEWGSLEKIAGKGMSGILWDAFADAARPRSVRIASLSLTGRVTDSDEIARRFTTTRVPDTWFADMRWWIITFGTVPRGRNECDWAQAWRHPSRAADLERIGAAHQLLSGQPGYLAAPRFAPALLQTARFQDRAVLSADLQRRLARLRHMAREPAYPGGPDDNQGAFTANAPALTLGDLLNLRLLLDWLENDAALRAVHAAGAADRADTSSEHGGFLRILPNPELVILPSLFSGSDSEYTVTDATLQQAYAAVAIVHFHFQQTDNGARAGPSVGDLAFARSQRATCLVITSISAREFNVDYYTPEGAVVDLGIYRLAPR